MMFLLEIHIARELFAFPEVEFVVKGCDIFEAGFNELSHLFLT